MDEDVKERIKKAYDSLREKIKADIPRREAASHELKELVEKTKLLSGGTFSEMDLCHSIEIQRKVQRISAIVLPKFLGNYNCKVYFQGYKKSKEEFAAEHPEFEGTTGYPGVDVKKFSHDLATLLTSSDNEFIGAFENIDSYSGVGIAILSGYLHLMYPDRYPLINGAAIDGLEFLIGKQSRKRIRDYAEQEKEKHGITIALKTYALQKYFGWFHLCRMLLEIEGIDDYHIVDSFLWMTSVGSKDRPAGKEPTKRMEKAGVSYWRVIEPFDTKERTAWPQCREHSMIAIGYHKKPNATDVRYMRDDMKIGDKIVAYLEKYRIGGIGTIVGDYEDYDEERPADKDYFDGDYWRRRKVRWDYLPEEGEYWTVKRKVSGSRSTIYELSEQEFDDILAEIGIKRETVKQVREPQLESYVNTFQGFTNRTFELLESLHRNPTRAFYLESKADFKRYVELPLQNLMRDVATQLSASIVTKMETESRIFGRILKNDWGKGGAWDFYWGAFYPEGGKRTQDAQLFVWMNFESLRFGFYIGEYGVERRRMFLKNIAENREAVTTILKQNLSTDVFYGRTKDFVGRISDKSAVGPKRSLEYWLNNLDEKAISIAEMFTKDEVLQTSPKILADRITQTFAKLYPLVILAVAHDPLPEVHEYLEMEEEVEINEDYTLAECAADTGFSTAILSQWVRAIKRKKQAIFYGPPGTGKTFVAEKLAKHLIANGDGFMEIIQFHPAYAYEDFMQGIRPKRISEGQLDYPLIPGRFLEFTKKALACKDTCVLIIDEINRANLARVFGELMYLLEYRDRFIPLAGGGQIRIPQNVRIIGTMNTADRSIALVDHALRRRFAFLALYPQFEVLRSFHADTDFPIDKLISALQQLNSQIGDKHYHVGITFFLRKDLSKQLSDIWRMEIEPYLEEYFFDQPDKVEQFRFDKIKDKILS